MAKLCRSGSQMKCSFGATPSILNVPPVKRVNAVGPPAATIMDNKPTVNIPPFGMCSSPLNPAVAAATAAALGVLTPMPCVPVPVAPWIPGSRTVTLGAIPSLNDTSLLFCQWAGVIEITDAA